MPKILGVDDSQTMRRILEMTFAGDGNSSIATVADGDSAVRWATENGADIVLADASMKGTDGYEVARALRTNPATQHVAVIVLASQHHPYDAEKGRTCGVDDHVLKPFETQAMLDKVRDVLGRPRVPAAGAAARPAAAPVATSTPGSTVAARPVAPPSPPRPAPAAPAAPMAPARPAAPQRANTIAFGTAAPVARPATAAAPPAASLSAFPTPPARTTAPSTAPNPASGMLPLIAGQPASGHTATAPQPAFVPQPSRADAPSVAAAIPAPKPTLELQDESPAEAAAPASTTAVTAAASATASNGEMAHRLSGMGLSPQQIDGVLALSREVIERVVWEVVPDLAETIIREEIRRLTSQ